MPPRLRPALFLDRDGVIIENRPDYVRSIREVQFIPGALTALAQMARGESLIVIATNQSAIGRGLLSAEQAAEINNHVLAAIRAAGGRVDRLYLCPHRPDENCRCRKPQPGMLLDAARDLSIDLGASVMVGDAVTDVQAAQAAGVQPLFVLSGRESPQGLAAAGLGAVPIFPDLAAAVDWLANRTKTPPK